MEFGKRHDTTDTTDFCPRQLVTDYGLATGKVVKCILAYTQRAIKIVPLVYLSVDKRTIIRRTITWWSCVYVMRDGRHCLVPHQLLMLLRSQSHAVPSWYSHKHIQTIVPLYKYCIGISCHMESHSVTFHPTQVNTPRHNPSETGWYSIYLPQRDRRLSWPRWLVTLLWCRQALCSKDHTSCRFMGPYIPCKKKQHLPLVGETSSGLVMVDADWFTETAKRTCGAICESATASDA